MFDSSSFGSFVSFALANKLALSYIVCQGGRGGGWRRGIRTRNCIIFYADEEEVGYLNWVEWTGEIYQHHDDDDDDDKPNSAVVFAQCSGACWKQSRKYYANLAERSIKMYSKIDELAMQVNYLSQCTADKWEYSFFYKVIKL